MVMVVVVLGGELLVGGAVERCGGGQGGGGGEAVAGGGRHGRRADDGAGSVEVRPGRRGARKSRREGVEWWELLIKGQIGFGVGKLYTS